MTTREQRAQEVEQSAQIMFAHLGGGEWAEIEEWRRENFRQAANEVLAYSKAEVPEGDAATIHYRNHRGELATRRILPQRMWFGSTKWHPEPQWLLDAHDLDKGVLRSFALRDMLPAHVEADDETVERVDRRLREMNAAGLGAPHISHDQICAVLLVLRALGKGAEDGS